MLKKIDSFSRNILVVFSGTALASFLNLLCQLLIAHRLKPEDFAVFNTLLSIFMIISAPFLTLQSGIIKYISEFNARGEYEKIKKFISGISIRVTTFSFFVLIIFYIFSNSIMLKLQVPSIAAMHILTALIFLSCITPVFSGSIQGMEFFNWFAAASVFGGLLKLALVALFIKLGFNISGALSSFLITTAITLGVYYFVLKRAISVKDTGCLPHAVFKINYKSFFSYLFPVAISTFCFMVLVSSDMVLIKRYFSPADAGEYSLAQMVGKIFLFLPGAISIVMFPRTSGLHAKNMDTAHTLKKSLLYAFILCAAAAICYNFFPSLLLRILTGKTTESAVILGRMFSFSMSLFSLLFIVISYFLSKKDLRFVKWLVAFTILQIGLIILFHANLFMVQSVLCANVFLLFCIHLALFFKHGYLLKK